MTGPRIGSLFSGYGGLDLGVQAVLGGSTAWVSDVCKVTKAGEVGHHDPHRGACAVLAHRFPGVPNLGDITAVDWSAVEPVDIITGGSPCQDLSHAGKRAGMTDGSRSNLWVAMREAIAALRPGLVVWENVRGAFSACADSEMGRCPRCVGDDPRGKHAPYLRALGRVLGDLADLGYDAAWYGVRASDVGAPHQRFRVFVVAYPASDTGRLVDRDGQDAADVRGVRAGRGDTLSLFPTPSVADGTGGHLTRGGARSSEMLLPGVAKHLGEMFPTPTARDHKGTGGADGFAARAADGHAQPLPEVVAHLLPTPAVNDMGASYTPEAWDEWTERMKAAHGNGNGHGKSLSIEAQRMLPTLRAQEREQHNSADLGLSLSATAQRLLPTTTTTDHKASGASYPKTATHATGTTLTDATVRQPERWGQYAEAVARWEALTRPAPEPTMTSTKGTQQLSPAFAEWMMGLPAGWVTDVPGITRTEALKALGNGVVPQQAAHAVAHLLDVIAAEQVVA